MTRSSILAQGRAAAEASMVDACTITRVTATTTSATTGAVTATSTTVYTGKCRIQESGGYGRNAQPSPVDEVLMRYRILQLPVSGSDDVRAGDRVAITSCVHDPDLVGRTMVVRDQAGKSEATARRLGIEEVTG